MGTIGLILLLSVLNMSTGFPSGSPTGECTDMEPNHGRHDAQSSDSPYSITVNTLLVNMGDTVTGIGQRGSPLTLSLLIDLYCSVIRNLRKVNACCILY